MKKYLVLYFLFICSITILRSQTEIWNDIQDSQIIQISDREIIPDSYRVAELDIYNLKKLFDSSPIDFTYGAINNPTIVSLPMPDGRIERFLFWESPTLAPELQLQFPEIRTYTGQVIDDKAATLKMDLTPHGFHAMILPPNGRVFIDPYDKGNIKYYISYYTKYFTKSRATLDCQLFIKDIKLAELK